MSINTKLPVFSISTQKLTLSADAESVLWCGLAYPTVNFVNVVVPSLLAYMVPYSAAAINLMSEMVVNGFSIQGYGKYASAWSETIAQRREEHERRTEEARAHIERMAAMNATPTEIAAEKAKREQRDADIARRFGDRAKGAAFGM